MSPRQTEILRAHAFKPGNNGHGGGLNRWTAAQKRFRELMLAPVPEDPEGRRRFDLTILATFESSLMPGMNGAADRRLIVEQICGKARDAPKALDFAEHLRQVERDRINTAVSILGPKLREKKPEEVAEFIERLCNEPDKFLAQANQVMGEGEPAPQPELPPEKPEGEP